jgi:cytoskeletal protein RodZ
MTRLFGKKNDKTTIAELEEYYANQNQRRTRPLRAWFMAFLSLFIAVAIIIGLVFAGQWLYTTLTSDDESMPATTGDTSGVNTVDLPTFDGDIVGQGNSNTGETTDSSTESSSSTDTNTTTSGDAQSSGVVSDQAASTSDSNTDRLANTGSDELPNTGAGDLVVIIPIAAGLAGYVISRRRQIRQQ